MMDFLMMKMLITVIFNAIFVSPIFGSIVELFIIEVITSKDDLNKFLIKIPIYQVTINTIDKFISLTSALENLAWKQKTSQS